MVAMSTEGASSKPAPQFVVRFPDESDRDRIAEAAKENNRSMNAEILARLHTAFATEQRNGELQAEVLRVEAALKQMTEHLKQQERELHTTADRVQDLGAQVADSRARLELSEKRQADLLVDRDRLRAQLAQREMEMRDMAEEHGGAKARYDARQRQLQELKAHVETFQAEHQKTIESLRAGVAAQQALVRMLAFYLREVAARVPAESKETQLVMSLLGNIGNSLVHDRPEQAIQDATKLIDYGIGAGIIPAERSIGGKAKPETYDAAENLRGEDGRPSYARDAQGRLINAPQAGDFESPASGDTEGRQPIDVEVRGKPMTLKPRADGDGYDVVPRTTPAPTEPSRPDFDIRAADQPDGTLVLLGDTDAIKRMLKAAGFTKFIRAKGGVCIQSQINEVRAFVESLGVEIQPTAKRIPRATQKA